jgi:hypothetical protein
MPNLLDTEKKLGLEEDFEGKTSVAVVFKTIG